MFSYELEFDKGLSESHEFIETYLHASSGLETFLADKHDYVYSIAFPGQPFGLEIVSELRNNYRGGEVSIMQIPDDPNHRVIYWAGAWLITDDKGKPKEDVIFYAVEHYNIEQNEWHEDTKVELDRAYIITKEPENIVIKPPKELPIAKTRLQKLARKLIVNRT